MSTRRGRQAGVLALAAVAMLGGTTPASATRSASLDQERMIAAVNAERARYGTDPVAFAEQLYPAASKFARQCKLVRADGHGKFADNLYVAPGKVPFAQALRSWMQEAGKYDYNKPGFSPATSHFTQTVWAGSTSVAIVVVNCPAGTILDTAGTLVVARFAPPGNASGEFSKNVGSPR